MSSDRGVDCAVRGAAIADGEVEFVYPAIREELDEPLMGGDGFGRDHDPGGVFVKAVDDAWAEGVASRGELLAVG